MRIEVHGHGLEVTAALHDYVETRFKRVQRYLEQSDDIRVQLKLDKPRHCAEATVTRHGRTLHVDAVGDDMYAAIDLLTDKLERALVRAKEKQHDQARRTEGLARSGEFG